STARWTSSIRGRMQIFVDRLRSENRVLLWSLRGIVLPHYRLVNPVSALEHPSGVVGIPTPTQIRMPIRRAGCRSARLQYVNLVKVAGYLYGRFCSLGRCILGIRRNGKHVETR